MMSPSYPRPRRCARGARPAPPRFLIAGLTWWLLLACAVGAAPTRAVDLQNVEFAALPGNRVEIQLSFSGPVAAPTSFATESPARIALDFEGATSKLDRKAIPINVGAVHSLIAVEASNRTRVVVNLNDSVPYEVAANGNKVTLKISTQDAPASVAPPPRPVEQPAPMAGPAAGQGAGARPASASGPAAPPRSAGAGGAVRDIDFRRGTGGEGRVVIKLPSAKTRVAVREQAGHVFVDLYDSSLPPRLFRRLDVTDFATPVTAVESKASGRNVVLDIQTGAEYDYLAYQTDDLFTLEFRALTPAEKEQNEKKKVVFKGDRLSLNFQDIEVRAVLQLLADFTGLNLIASDNVRGNITLRLKNVPWDQALDIILKSKGLAMRQTDNVIMVAPSQELAAAEKLELESQKQIEELAPLRTEYIQVNYAKAADLANMLKSDKSNLLTKDRGNVTIDVRTNTLLVQDTTAKLEDIRRLVGRLDVPVRQVMIESRIVIANNDFARDLGVRFGVSGATGSLSSTQMMTAGGMPGNLAIAGYDKGSFGLDVSKTPVVPFNAGIVNPAGSGNQSLLVNLPAVAPSGAVNFLIGKVGSYLMQLELSAMQLEGRGEIISSPRVITSDAKKATIKMGQQIPYTTSAGGGGGATTTEFKDAVLQLDVTPQITPDDRVIMELKVDKNAPDWTRVTNSGVPINTRSVETTVLVDNGETVVLGGVFEREKAYNKEQVPWLGDVPMLGRLFKKEARKDNNSELLIFVTPKILKGEAVRN
ncbi:type IV pilus secretin PilQ [Candidatus Thiodictyon syntrophicum]|uniref:Pilus assembly protein PilQ n=1 Tax=Candidatus Thiodictyon syntrophicum TaxID=1166950 RepID=A0A2K8U8C8_9GAMM|nr:pilus assembly protein PilQ [Candidatus Thiodictyon syntrophicum]